MLLEILKMLTPKDTPKKKTKAQTQKEKDARERLLWERAEEYEEYDDE
jgi:hypothetical protein